MINNYLCIHCDKRPICEWCKVLSKKFDENSKSCFGVTITINECEQFGQAEENENEDE